MRQVTIKTRRDEDGFVELSVNYTSSDTLLKMVQNAGRSLTRTRTSLFVSVNSKSETKEEWRFFATMNPNGSPEVVLSNLALFRVWAERLTGAICCIDMAGFSEEPTKKPVAKKRPRSK